MNLSCACSEYGPAKPVEAPGRGHASATTPPPGAPVELGPIEFKAGSKHRFRLSHTSRVAWSAMHSTQVIQSVQAEMATDGEPRLVVAASDESALPDKVLELADIVGRLPHFPASRAVKMGELWGEPDWTVRMRFDGRRKIRPITLVGVQTRLESVEADRATAILETNAEVTPVSTPLGAAGTLASSGSVRLSREINTVSGLPTRGFFVFEASDRWLGPDSSEVLVSSTVSTTEWHADGENPLERTVPPLSPTPDCAEKVDRLRWVLRGAREPTQLPPWAQDLLDQQKSRRERTELWADLIFASLALCPSAGAAFERSLALDRKGELAALVGDLPNAVVECDCRGVELGIAGHAISIRMNEGFVPPIVQVRGKSFKREHVLEALKLNSARLHECYERETSVAAASEPASLRVVITIAPNGTTLPVRVPSYQGMDQLTAECVASRLAQLRFRPLGKELEDLGGQTMSFDIPLRFE